MVDGPALAPLRAAIIGLGNIAWQYDAEADGSTLTHRSSYRHDQRTQLVAGYDPDPAQRSRFGETTGVATTATLDALLVQRPDIVSICSPNGLHGEHLRACLMADIPMIWLEKPATTSAADARDLLALQRQRGTSTILVGFQRRYQPAYQRLRSLMLDRELGNCAGISITYSRGLETNGVHLLDLLFQFMGDIASYELCGVTGAAGDTASPSFVLQFADGTPCTVIGLTLDHHSIDITVHFDAGRAAVLHGGAKETRETRVENPLYPGFHRLAFAPSPPLSDSLQHEAMIVFPAMLDDLIASHQAGREPNSSLATAIAAQTLVERVLAASSR